MTLQFLAEPAQLPALAPPPPMPPMRVLCMGAGVDTTAMLLMWPKRYAAVLFADVGSEEPETYEHINKRLKPFCAEHDLPWFSVVAHRPDPDHPRAGEKSKAAAEFTRARNALGIRYSLEEHCLTRGILPITARRWCTSRFKIDPINAWCKAAGATPAHQIVKDIGIAYDEAWRLNKFGAKDPRYVRCEYPLVDHKMTREDCLDVIRDYGWPTTAKSGCDFCMFKRRDQFRRLARDRPQRFQEILALEENAMWNGHGPLLKSGRLRLLVENDTLDPHLEGIEAAEAEQSCETGYCFG